MTDRFVDTSGWAAWASARQAHHAAAVGRIAETVNAGRRLVTTNWVLAELTALVTKPVRLTKPERVRLIDTITGDTAVRVLTVDAPLEAAAWQLWRTRLDKDWSLTDCASFAAMTRLGLTDALTADHHFEQAGFGRLLK